MGNLAHQNIKDETDVFGFWLYILSDVILFGALFATYLVLSYPGAYGPSLKNYIDLNFVLIETMVLLSSNYCFGLSAIQFNKGNLAQTQFYLILTFLFGGLFVSMEIYEFYHLVHEGYIWSVSAAASSFFTLVGTHGLHVSAGLIWCIVLVIQIRMFGSNSIMKKRFFNFGLFWNFLDIVWIFLFSIVYLLGVI